MGISHEGSQGQTKCCSVKEQEEEELKGRGGEGGEGGGRGEGGLAQDQSQNFVEVKNI